MKTTDLIKSWEDTLPGVAYRIDLSSGGMGHPVFLSDKIEELCGYTADEILSGKINWVDLILDEDRDYFLKNIEPRSDKSLYSLEYRVRHKNGQIKCVLSRALIKWVNNEPRWRVGTIFDITEQKQKDQSLNKQGQFLEWVAKTAKIGGWEVDILKRTIWWSDEIYNIRELERSGEPSLDDAFDYYTEDARPVIKKAVDDGLENGKGWDLELPIITALGNKKWVRDVGIPEIKNGKCVALRGVLQDITEKKIAEIILKEKEQGLELALEGAKLGTWNQSFETGETVYNERWTQMIGYTLSEFKTINLKWENLIHPDDLLSVLEAWNKHLTGASEYFETEYRLKHKFGHWVWVLDKGKVMERDERGNALRASGTHMDINERKAVELQNSRLRLELEEFKAAVSESFIVSIADVRGIIVYANPRFEEISQYKINELIGNKHNIINSGYHPKSFWQEMWQTVSQGKAWRADVKNKRKDGSFYWVDTFIMPLTNTDNKIVRYLSIRNDITDKKENEVKLLSALEKAEESDRLKSSFLTNMSHEIRTPMNAILGFSELLESANLSDQKRREFSKLISQRGHDLLNIVNDILDISKLELKQVSLVNVVGNINELIGRLLLTFHSNYPRLRNKKINVIAHNELKPEQNLVMGDFIRLYQVLNNLITNACKFTFEGTIEIGCQLQNSTGLLFWVKDTGIGIPKDQLEAIFKPFRQATDNIHQTYGGTGLGLAISKGFVELWGGRIWVESEVGSGSTFYFSMPFLPANRNTPFQLTNLCSHNWKNKSALMVEDDMANARYILELLAPTKINVEHIIQGKDALLRLNNSPIDFVILDLGLPDISGLEVAQSIKFKFPKLPVIVLTAYASVETRSKCDNIGVDYFLTKPVPVEKLIAIVYEILD